MNFYSAYKHFKDIKTKKALSFKLLIKEDEYRYSVEKQRKTCTIRNSIIFHNF